MEVEGWWKAPPGSGHASMVRWAWPWLSRGGWRLEVGGWRLEVGEGRMEVGGWWKAPPGSGHASMVRCAWPWLSHWGQAHAPAHHHDANPAQYN